MELKYYPKRNILSRLRAWFRRRKEQRKGEGGKMTKTLTLWVSGKPQGKARARVCVRGKRAFAYTPENTVSYENLIKVLCMQAIREAPDLKPTQDEFTGAFEIQIKAKFLVPKSASKKLKADMLSGKVKHLHKPDSSNIQKSIEDACIGSMYHDDSQIYKSTIEKMYVEWDEGVEVTFRYGT